MKTVLITGCSSGFGRAIAQHFAERDWAVVATMRSPNSSVMPAARGLRVLPLDVTDDQSIARAIDDAGPIDVLVNNAGIGLMNPLETASMQTIRGVFETNVFGLMALTKAVLPQFRERRSGVIVNISSSVTLRPIPLLSAYTATKAAVNALTESLAVELEQFGIRTRLILPGRSPETAFASNAGARTEGEIAAPYAEIAAQLRAGFETSQDGTTSLRDVAEAVWRAATDPLCPMRLPAGDDAVAWAAAHSAQRS